MSVASFLLNKVACLSASLPLCLSASLPLCLSASLPLCLSALVLLITLNVFMLALIPFVLSLYYLNLWFYRVHENA